MIEVSGKPDRQFLAGQLYFFLTYCDPQLNYPVIESYVFLGLNLSEEDAEDTWYFQPAADYVRHGSAIESNNRPVFCANSMYIADFLTEAELAERLEQSLQRRSAGLMK